MAPSTSIPQDEDQQKTSRSIFKGPLLEISSSACVAPGGLAEATTTTSDDVQLRLRGRSTSILRGMTECFLKYKLFQLIL
jgi:hypothetical protein